jgi:hypothetical protein
MYIYVTFHVDRCKFIVLFMYTDVNLWYFSCTPMYIYGTFHIHRYIFMVLFMYTDVHLWYFSCTAMYIYGTFHIHRCTFMLPRSASFKMRNVSDEICREIQNTHFTFNNIFPENRAVYEIMWKNSVQRCRPHVTI